MSRKSAHNLKVKARILAAAGRSFRSAGYAGARIDALMAEAGLTRGAFYAHFPSKAALFCAVLREEDLLLTLLRGRSANAPDALALGLLDIFRRSLSPAHAATAAEGWSLVALMRDAGEGGRTAGEAYAAALAETLSEMARGLACAADDPRLAAALAQACGALGMAAACPCEATRARLLGAAAAGTTRLISDAAGLSD